MLLSKPFNGLPSNIAHYFVLQHILNPFDIWQYHMRFAQKNVQNLTEKNIFFTTFSPVKYFKCIHKMAAQ